MTEQRIIMAGGAVGALTGILIGYLFFTPRGNEWRVDAEKNLATFLQEAERLLSAADQVRQSVADLRGGQSGWPRSA